MADASSFPGPGVAPGLRYSNDDDPGIRRVARAGGLAYRHTDGSWVRDAGLLRRIRTLAVPPAWTDVWICPDERGHIQATGRDARGRKQYRYHELWRQARDQDKFSRMAEFGQRLPALRRRLRRDLALPGLPREKVLAAVVTLLERTLVRVGNDEYARSNGSYGLTTLRDRHVKFLSSARAQLRFRGKSGLLHEVTLDDPHLVRIVRRCGDLPGEQLFQYLDADGRPQAVDSTLVNDYLREVMGEDFTAKDFRTWGATLRAIMLMCATALPEPRSERACKACVTAAIKAVARALNNTPAVCRKAYIHPGVFEAWRAGTLPARPAGASGLRKAERLALAFLRSTARTRPARGTPSPRPAAAPASATRPRSDRK